MRELTSADLPDDEPPRVSPTNRAFVEDPCSHCGAAVRLASLEPPRGELAGARSRVYRFEEEVEAAILESGEIPPATWLQRPEGPFAVEPGAVTVATVLCGGCGQVEQRVGFQVADVIG